MPPSRQMRRADSPMLDPLTPSSQVRDTPLYLPCFSSVPFPSVLAVLLVLAATLHVLLMLPPPRRRLPVLPCSGALSVALCLERLCQRPRGCSSADSLCMSVCL